MTQKNPYILGRTARDPLPDETSDGYGRVMDHRDEFAARFWSKVKIGGGCWEWKGFREVRGYGRFEAFLAHKVAYELTVGQIPVGHTLDHLCKHPWCVNPAHLEPVTNQENIRRGKPRKEYAAPATLFMPCPTCGEELDKVTDSRPRGEYIRRRRECRNGHRATTMEYVVGDAA